MHILLTLLPLFLLTGKAGVEASFNGLVRNDTRRTISEARALIEEQFVPTDGHLHIGPALVAVEDCRVPMLQERAGGAAVHLRLTPSDILTYLDITLDLDNRQRLNIAVYASELALYRMENSTVYKAVVAELAGQPFFRQALDACFYEIIAYAFEESQRSPWLSAAQALRRGAVIPATISTQLRIALGTRTVADKYDALLKYEVAIADVIENTLRAHQDDLHSLEGVALSVVTQLLVETKNSLANLLQIASEVVVTSGGHLNLPDLIHNTAVGGQTQQTNSQSRNVQQIRHNLTTTISGTLRPSTPRVGAMPASQVSSSSTRMARVSRRPLNSSPRSISPPAPSVVASERVVSAEPATDASRSAVTSEGTRMENTGGPEPESATTTSEEERFELDPEVSALFAHLLAETPQSPSNPDALEDGSAAIAPVPSPSPTPSAPAARAAVGTPQRTLRQPSPLPHAAQAVRGPQPRTRASPFGQSSVPSAPSPATAPPVSGGPPEPPEETIGVHLSSGPKAPATKDIEDDPFVATQRERRQRQELLNRKLAQGPLARSRRVSESKDSWWVLPVVIASCGVLVFVVGIVVVILVSKKRVLKR